MSNNLLIPKKDVGQRIPNTVTLISTAKRKNMSYGDLYIDVSRFMDDIFEWASSGLDKYVQGTLYGLHEEFLTNMVELIKSIGLERGLLVVIACERGERRSVATVELLARELKSAGINSLIQHKELDKWLKF